MNLGEFHDLIAVEAGKGSTLDTIIPAKVRQAARWLEQNYNLKYMDRYVGFTFDLGVTNPRAIEFPSHRVKRFNFFRIVQDTGEYQYLQPVDPQDVTATEDGEPSGYWLDGRDYLWLDNTPVEALVAELSYIEYTDWDSLVDEDEPWLLTHAEQAMIGQTIMLLTPTMRQPGLFQTYKLMRDEGLKALVDADNELLLGAAGASMNYS